jgi:hypothetical protein
MPKKKTKTMMDRGPMEARYMVRLHADTEALLLEIARDRASNVSTVAREMIEAGLRAGGHR